MFRKTHAKTSTRNTSREVKVPGNAGCMVRMPLSKPNHVLVEELEARRRKHETRFSTLFSFDLDDHNEQSRSSLIPMPKSQAPHLQLGETDSSSMSLLLAPTKRARKVEVPSANAQTQFDRDASTPVAGPDISRNLQLLANFMHWLTRDQHACMLKCPLRSSRSVAGELMLRQRTAL